MNYLFANLTSAPAPGQSSMTDAMIIQAYQYWLGRSPYSPSNPGPDGDTSELASEENNALKYSAAGIERTIAARSGNVPGAPAVALPSVTVPYVAPVVVTADVAGNVAAVGPSATQTSAVGPTGLIVATQGPTVTPAVVSTASAPTSTILGFDPTTLIILAVVAGAAWFLIKRV